MELQASKISGQTWRTWREPKRPSEFKEKWEIFFAWLLIHFQETLQFFHSSTQKKWQICFICGKTLYRISSKYMHPRLYSINYGQLHKQNFSKVIWDWACLQFDTQYWERFSFFIWYLYQDTCFWNRCFTVFYGVSIPDAEICISSLKI